MADVPDSSPCEDEEIKPTPKRLHSIVQQRLILLLSRELGLDDVVLTDLAVEVMSPKQTFSQRSRL